MGDRLQMMKNYIKDPQVWLRGRADVLAGAAHTQVQGVCFVAVSRYRGLI